MILIINLCREKLHYFEFVKPVEEIVKNLGGGYFSKNYAEVTNTDLEKAEKIIICGTSLQDNDYSEHLDKFSFIKTYKKPILGICAGMQIIAKIFNGKIKNGQEIGFKKIKFEKEFFGLAGEKEVDCLHNFAVDNLKEFENYAKNEFVQAVKHKNREIYGVLFHPEARQKDLIRNFVKINNGRI